jgi:hypothetical protein
LIKINPYRPFVNFVTSSAGLVKNYFVAQLGRSSFGVTNETFWQPNIPADNVTKFTKGLAGLILINFIEWDYGKAWK